MPFADLLERYAREVSPKKRGHRWEAIRLEKLGQDPIARVRLADLCATIFAEWRDRRLHEVSPASVAREMSLLSAVLTQVRREWRLISVNPLSDVRKSSLPAPRT